MRVAVMGGGISGMATAYAIQEKAKQQGLEDVKIFVIEKEERLGGKIKTEIINGWVCEDGPLGYIDKKPEVASLVHRLNLESELVVASDSAAKRYIFVDHKLQEIAMSPAFITSHLLSWGSKLGMLHEPWTKPAEPGKDESVWEFGARHLGKEAADKMISAMIVGIYAGDAEKLSIKCAFPVMVDLEKEGDGSLIRASLRRQKAKRAKAKAEGKTVGRPKSEEIMGFSGKLTTFRRGMEYIIGRLKERFDGEIKSGVGVRSIASGESGYSIDLDDGFKLDVDLVVMATPGYATSQILTGFDDGLAEDIGKIPFVPVNVAVFGYDAPGFEHDLNGFGFVVPKIEKRGILGCLWNTSIFAGQAPDGKVSLRVMLGGAINPDVTKMDDRETIDFVQRELRTTMGISQDPGFTYIARHEKAIPQYLIGHADILERIEERMKRHRGLFLTGNTYRGIGFNDCVINAEHVASKIIAHVKDRDSRHVMAS